MEKKYKLEVLTPAQKELEEIAGVHMELVGPISAQKITDCIYSALENLETFLELGVACKDKQLAALGYRMLICGNYLSIYRRIGIIIYVYHIVDGRTNYPKLFSDLTKNEIND